MRTICKVVCVCLTLLLAVIMPTKKASSNPADKESKEDCLTLMEEKDPVAIAMSVVDKKTRNLEKRKVCFMFTPCDSWYLL